jgi:HlyD family secretion protein
MASAEAAVQTAEANVASAQAKLDTLLAGPATGDLAAAQGQVASNEASLASAQAKLAQLQSPNAGDVQAARTAVDAARTSYNSAVARLEQVQAGATASDLAAAQATVNANEANVRSAQAKLDQLLAGPQNADVVAALAAVTEAQNNLQLKLQPYTQADILAQQQALSQAQANLQKALNPSTASDVAAQQQAVRSAEASLSKAQTPYLPSDILAAQADVEQAQTNVVSAQNDLAGAVITAPFDGMVSAVAMAVGEPVGTTSIITVVDPNQVRVDVQIDESDVAKVDVGQTANVTFDALGQRRFQGTVTSIAPAGTTTQGVVGYQASIQLQNARGVRPGMTASASVVTDERSDVITVPNRAITRQGNNRTVRVVTPDGVETRTVQIGLANDQSTEIISGLNEGETVVIPTTTARASVPGGTNLTGSGGAGFGAPAGGR